jgi:hypothetical protein
MGERDPNLRSHSLIQKIWLRCYRGLLGGSSFASLCACVERERVREREVERERERLLQYEECGEGGFRPP